MTWHVSMPRPYYIDNFIISVITNCIYILFLLYSMLNWVYLVIFYIVIVYNLFHYFYMAIHYLYYIAIFFLVHVLMYCLSGVITDTVWFFKQVWISGEYLRFLNLPCLMLWVFWTHYILSKSFLKWMLWYQFSN